MDILTLYDGDQNKVVVHNAKRVRSHTWYAEWSVATANGERYDRQTGEFHCSGAYLEWLSTDGPIRYDADGRPSYDQARSFCQLDEPVKDLVCDALYMAWKRRRAKRTAGIPQLGRSDA